MTTMSEIQAANSDYAPELAAAHSLLSDIMAINDMREKIDAIENKISSGGRAMFYFFASSLDHDEVVFAAEKVRGKINRIKDRLKKESTSDAEVIEE